MSTDRILNQRQRIVAGQRNVCPNGHGSLVMIRDPCFVPPTEDLTELASSLPRNKKIYRFIYGVCPVCGFYQSTELSQNEFDEAKGP